MPDNPFEAYYKQRLRDGIVSDDEEDAFLALDLLCEHYRDKQQLLLGALMRTDWLDDKTRKAISGLTPRRRANERETPHLRFLVEAARADGDRAPLKSVAGQHGIAVKTLKQRLLRARRDDA
jgi:hypothetical protein